MAELYWIRTPEMTDMFTEGYVGMSTVSARARWSAHRASAKLESKSHLPIYRAFRKYGADNLVMSVIVVGPDDYITDMEIKLRPHEGIGWNCAMGGQDTGKGRTQSAEEIEKRAAKIRGRKHSDEVKMRMSLASKGKPKSESHKQKCREANLGKIRSAEAREKQRQVMLGRSTMTDDGKKRLSEFQKELNPWERSRSNVTVWFYAQDLFDARIDGDITQRAIAKMLKVKDSTASALVAKLREGWCPMQDTEWVSWKAVTDAPTLGGDWKPGDPQPEHKIPVRPDTTGTILPWNSARANKFSWSNCIQIKDLMDSSITPKAICESFELDSKQKPLDTIFKKIKSGWNPSEDAAYLAWLAEYNKHKECPNGT